MKIKKVIETPDGSFTFEGDVSEKEHAFILEAGLNYLIQAGIIPFKAMTKQEDFASYHKPEQDTPQ